jgi:hypothetical protein
MMSCSGRNVIASEAKQSIVQKLDCFFAFAPRNDEGDEKRKWPKKRKPLEFPQANACAAGSVSKSIRPRAGPGTIIRRAAGARMARAYATYVGSWRKRFRITKGKAEIARFEDKVAKTARSFCRRCGTPLTYERARSPHMVNIPRALFTGRTGRQPLYHIAIEELQEWAYTGEPLVPLKGFPGVVWQRSKRKKRVDHEGMF